MVYLNNHGTLKATRSSLIGNTIHYTGRRLDTETGLYYVRARYYNSTLGRFVGRDPIGYEGSRWSLYEYCESSPMVKLDPSGNQTTISPPKPDIKITPSGPEVNIEFPSKNPDGPKLKIPIQMREPPNSSGCTMECPFIDSGKSIHLVVQDPCMVSRDCKVPDGFFHPCAPAQWYHRGTQTGHGYRPTKYMYTCTCKAVAGIVSSPCYYVPTSEPDPRGDCEVEAWSKCRKKK